MIKIICVGKLKENYTKELCNDYIKRISKYQKIEIIELKDSTKEEENKLIQKHLNKEDYIFACNIKGKEYSTIELSNKIDNIFITKPNITFIIGGSEGLSKETLEKSNEIISFSKLTFPHNLFRGMLLEQIYRVFKILNNESYHK